MNLLLASSNTKDGIIECICRFWGTDNINLEYTDNGKDYRVFIGDRLMDKVIVSKTKRRFRFEMIRA